jgi:TRAP-type C4-dicarboxylate transport system permease small subunit
MNKWLERLNAGGSLALLVAVVATIMDVVGRATGLYFPRGVNDIVGITMVVTISMALAACEWSQSQIRVEPLSGWLPRRARDVLDRFWHVVAGVCLGLCAYLSFNETLMAHRNGEVTPSLGATKLVYGVVILVGFGIAAAVTMRAAARRSGDGSDAEGRPEGAGVSAHSGKGNAAETRSTRVKH